MQNNIKSEMIPKIEATLKFVLENQHSAFYRKKYAGLNLTQIFSYDDLRKIPFLTKDELLHLSVAERTFVPQESIQRYSFSSGTAGHKKIFAVPNFRTLSASTKNESIRDYEYGEQVAKDKGVKKSIVLWPISSSAFSRNMTTQRESMITIAGDVHHLDRSALAAKTIGIDGIITTATILEYFLEHLEKISFDFSSIKWVSLGGEFCSSQKFEYFKNKLPDAFISFRFGSSEIGGRGYRCQHLADAKPYVFHPVPYGLLEILHEDGSASPFGEIIHTTLDRRPLPLIRYRTGDMAKLEHKPCPCGNDLLLTVGGRTEFDVLKFSGITLHTQAIEDALLSIKDHIKPNFQMHVFERSIAERPKPQLEIWLQFKKEFQEIENDPIFVEVLAKKISDHLHLSSRSTLTQLVEQNIFLPLSLKLVKDWPLDHHKSKNIISHLN